MSWRTLSGDAPEIIAHRGASGLLPEHTIAGYALGLQQGADVIEPDLVPSADGVLFCRHELELVRSTDIASRPGFAGRDRDGEWLSTDLRADELDRLCARQPFAGRSTEHDGRHRVPRFSAMLDWASAAAAERRRPVVLYPEIKHPQRLADVGHDPVPIFIDVAQRLPAGVALRLQCFDPAALQRLHAATGLPCTLLLDARSDWRTALRVHGTWLTALGVDKALLADGLVDEAHAAGLRVDAWTFRDDQPDPAYRSIERELGDAMVLGVDGLFCDFPATAVAVRNALPA